MQSKIRSVVRKIDIVFFFVRDPRESKILCTKKYPQCKRNINNNNDSVKIFLLSALSLS